MLIKRDSLCLLLFLATLGIVKQAEQLYDAYISVLHACQKTAVVQNSHPVIKAMEAIVIHLIGITTMLHERFGDYVRDCGLIYGHFRDLGTTGLIASLKLGKRIFCSMNFKLIPCSYLGTRTHMIGTTGILTFLFCIERNILSHIIYMQIVIQKIVGV